MSHHGRHYGAVHVAPSMLAVARHGASCPEHSCLSRTQRADPQCRTSVRYYCGIPIKVLPNLIGFIKQNTGLNMFSRTAPPRALRSSCASRRARLPCAAARSAAASAVQRTACAAASAGPFSVQCTNNTPAVGAAFTQWLYGCGGPQSVPPVARGAVAGCTSCISAWCSICDLFALISDSASRSA